MGWLFHQYSKRPDYKPSNKIVHIVKNNNQFTLIRNGQPFEIKGAAGSSNFQILSEIGGNTIRVYDTVNLKAVLDEAEKFNLAVIVDIPIPNYHKDYFNYQNKNLQNNLKESVKSLVNQYKNHPALLMWNLGNELHFPITPFANEFNTTYKELINIIKTEDPNHPLSVTTEGSRSKTLFLFFNFPEIDIYGFNTFGALHETEEKLKTLKPVYGKFPFFISEWGCNGPWEVSSNSWGATTEPFSSEKVNQLIRNYNFIKILNTGSSIGSLLFYWGHKHESTHTWFSMFDRENKPSHQIKTLEQLWKDRATSNLLFNIQDITINNHNSAENLVFKPTDTLNAQINFTYLADSLNNNQLTFKWELYPEIWHYRFRDYEKTAIKTQLISTKKVTSSIEFRTLLREGPYRLFVNIYDSNNYFATANLSFYVLEKP